MAPIEPQLQPQRTPQGPQPSPPVGCGRRSAVARMNGLLAPSPPMTRPRFPQTDPARTDGSPYTAAAGRISLFLGPGPIRDQGLSDERRTCSQVWGLDSVSSVENLIDLVALAAYLAFVNGVVQQFAAESKDFLALI